MTNFQTMLAISFLLLVSGAVDSGELVPPQGFTAIFNGKDLTGWHGERHGQEPHLALEQDQEEFCRHWRVENGELVNDGYGPYATSDEHYDDVEIHIEYATVPGADSGIYLRGKPQVQIWDRNQVFNPDQPTRRPHLGSGGLFNNTPGLPGRDPLVMADKPFGEWNQFRIRQIGAMTWVWLNGHLVVDGAVMEDYSNRSQPLPATGPIQLQTHGGKIRWRNLFVRKIGADEVNEILRNNEVNRNSLTRSLSLHASFDNLLDADFSRGDRTCYIRQGGKLLRADTTDDVKLAKDGGKFGGGLRFARKKAFSPAFRNPGVLNYNDRNWNGTVSVWLKLNPDEDLEPGYCDPVAIVGDDSKKGFIFLEFSKDETPRYFRYAIRPLFHIWNPEGVRWDEIPFGKRPMVQVERPPFSRRSWTHVVFTVENINDAAGRAFGRLYLNGELQGSINDWDLRFGWDPSQVLLVLGMAYVGHMDDLAVFNRVLTDAEIHQIHGLKSGIRELYLTSFE